MRATCTAAIVAACALFDASLPTHAAAATDAKPASVRPSFLIVLLDDLDAELGGPDVLKHTRRLVADQGMTLSSHFVSTPLCCPSRATLLTARYTHNHRVYRNRGPLGGFQRFRSLGLEQESLAVALQRRGYRTAMFGKYLNHYHGPKVRPGWGTWFVGDATPFGGFDYTISADGRRMSFGRREEDYVTDVLAARAATFLERQAAGAPFFLLFAPYAPHSPAIPAPRHAKLFADREAPRSGSFNEADVSDKPPPVRELAPLTASRIADLDHDYRQRLRSLQAVDEAVERLVGVLQRRGLAESTYVVVTSDNGFHMGQHRLPSGKGRAYEEDIRVPLYVSGPRVRVGAQERRLTTMADLPTTIASLAGAPLAHSDGRSLRPIWESSAPTAWREFVLVENFTVGDDEGPAESAADRSPRDTSRPLVAALRSDSVKYVEVEGGRWRELYLLDRDPDELENRISCLDRETQGRFAKLLGSMATCAGQSCRALEQTQLPSPPPGCLRGVPAP